MNKTIYSIPIRMALCFCSICSLYLSLRFWYSFMSLLLDSHSYDVLPSVWDKSSFGKPWNAALAIERMHKIVWFVEQVKTVCCLCISQLSPVYTPDLWRAVLFGGCQNGDAINEGRFLVGRYICNIDNIYLVLKHWVVYNPHIFCFLDFGWINKV